jgi:hypothetical protein
MSKRKILQIMPAPGWGALVADDDAPNEDYVSPLIGWALIEEDGAQTVVGMIAGEQIDFCDQLRHFSSYVQTQDMMMEALSQVVQGGLGEDDEDDDFPPDFEDEDDDPLPPPSFRRKGGRLN